MSWKYVRSLSLLAFGFLSVGGSLRGTTHPDHPWCGTTRSGFAAHAAVHEQQQRGLQMRTEALRSAPEAARVGDVAVLVDDGSMVVHPNPLDISGFGVQYVPQRRGGLVASPSGDPVSEEIGERLFLGDDDSREVAFPRGFRFPFFGRVHTRMFVHSDGNLTFVAPDAASTERSLDRLIGGPPRIAPLFADLNPETAAGNGGVYVLASPSRIVVTWLDLPEFGRSNRNTFQVVLYPNGRITFAFGGLSAQDAVVGVAPGGGGAVQLIDYTSLPTGVVRAGIAERFASNRSFDHLAVARAFFREFADNYDHLIVFLDFPQSLGGGFAFELTVKNDIRGIGLGLFDNTALIGSRGRLRSFVQMGTLARYPDDPHAEFLGTNSTLDILGQEAGHRWLAFFRFIDENGAPSDALLGRDLAHWSFCHHSLASDLEGNEYQDGGDRFTTIAATDRFSPLDQYAMGLIPPSQVPPFYYVEGCPVDRSKAPEIGVTVTGRRVDVTIDQVIAAEGPRVPDFRRAPRSFNMAFILVSEGGQFPSAESVAKVDRIRAAWESYFVQATDGRGSVSTALRPKPRRGGRR